MSLLVALAGPGAGGADAGAPPEGDRLLRALGPDAGERRAAWRGRHAWLAAASHAWEEALAGGAPLYADDALAVVADATLHHRADLLARLAARDQRPAPTRDAPAGDAALIAAAYRAWGDGLAGELEGDFAFVLLDLRRGRLVAARDFVGRRALYHGQVGDRLVVASSPEAIVAHPGADRALNVEHLAGRAAGLLEAWDTAWRAVWPLPAGHTLVAALDAGGRVAEPEIRRHWSPPTFEGGGPSFEEASAALRETLTAATLDRLAPTGATAVWLSGGWDSTAVYGVGQDGLRRGGDARPLHAASMSYPPGDPGREDELIDAVARFWGGDVRWRSIEGIPVFGDDAAAGARRRPQPFAHVFEHWMRALAATACEGGARVVLDGSGGDQLFQVSPIYLADLARRGRWAEARREWRALGLGGAGWRRFVRFGVLPVLPEPGWRLAALLRGGRPLRGLRAGVVPSWVRPAASPTLGERAELSLPRRPGESEAARESRWYFETSYSAAVFAEQRAIARSAGVEVRSPLLDGRVVALAAGRPRAERSSGGETKRLLRHALRGLLPPELLAPRRSRTGVTSQYFRQAMLRELPAVAAGVLQTSVLADLGVLDPGAFRLAVERYCRHGDAESGAALFATAQTELWLRARA